MPSLQHDRQAKATPAVQQASLARTSANGVRKQRTGRTYRKFAEVISLLMKRPRSALELYEMLELKPSGNSLQLLLRTMHEEGLIHIADWTRWPGKRLVAVYAWQPSICAFVDMKKPVPKRIKRLDQLKTQLAFLQTGVEVGVTRCLQVAPTAERPEHQ